MDIMKDLELLCDMLSDKIAEKTRKIQGSGMTDGDLETIDKLTHSLASVKKIMAFMEDEGYSGNYPMDGSYRYAYRGSYKRDRMGRYSGERGYSRNNLADKMREEMQRMVEKLENA